MRRAPRPLWPALLTRLARCRSGSVAIEAAGALSLLVLASVGAVDAARYAQASARAERLVANIADMAARSDSLRDRLLDDALTLPGDIGMFFRLAGRMALPVNLELGGVAVSSVSGGAAGNLVNWMRVDGAAALAEPRRLADLPALPAGAHFIVAEVFLPFEPILLDRARLGAGFDRQIYQRAVFRTRTSSLTILEVFR